MNIEYQIEQHAMILERWFSPEKARSEARRRIMAGQSWKWPEPVHLELFK